MRGKVHFCRICGFGYKNDVTAKECEKWCKTHKTCNLEIIKKAVETPK